jgi:hypothetical protein
MMHGRSPVAGFSYTLALTVAAVVLSAAPAAATDAGREETADQAQALSAFPVYTVTRAAGLPAYYETEVLEDHVFCDADVVRTVAVELRRGKLLTNGRRWIAMRQTDDRCAVGAVGKRVRTVRIFGRRVVVRRYCFGYMVNTCKGQPVSHRVHTMTFSLRAGSQRTFFALSASRMSIRAMLRAVRSLRRVDLSRPVVQLTSFLSPDGNAWCGVPGPGGVFPDAAFCVTFQPFRDGIVGKDGHVDLCDQDPAGCIPNFDQDAPRLADGQASELSGFRCVAQGVAVTCTLTKGEHAGKGFRIDTSAVVEVSPPG